MSELASITCPLQVELLVPALPLRAVDCELHYDAGDPLAVTATFTTPGQRVTWTFARSLLVSGCLEPTGDGDVNVRPALGDDGRAAVCLRLTSPDGSAVLKAATADVRVFLEMTLLLVPLGSELRSHDVDAAVKQLLRPTV